MKEHPELDKLKPGDRVITTNSCIGYQIDGAKGSYVQSTRGAQFDVGASGDILLRKGQILLRAGDQTTSVRTELASMIVPAGAIALIDAGRTNSVILLDDADKAGVLVFAGNDTHLVHQGEQLIAEVMQPMQAPSPTPTGAMATATTPPAGMLIPKLDPASPEGAPDVPTTARPVVAAVPPQQPMNFRRSRRAAAFASRHRRHHVVVAHNAHPLRAPAAMPNKQFPGIIAYGHVQRAHHARHTPVIVSRTPARRTANPIVVAQTAPATRAIQSQVAPGIETSQLPPETTARIKELVARDSGSSHGQITGTAIPKPLGNPGTAVSVKVGPANLDAALGDHALFACAAPHIKRQVVRGSTAGGAGGPVQPNEGLAEKFKGLRTQLPNEVAPTPSSQPTVQPAVSPVSEAPASKHVRAKTSVTGLVLPAQPVASPEPKPEVTAAEPAKDQTSPHYEPVGYQEVAAVPSAPQTLTENNNLVCVSDRIYKLDRGTAYLKPKQATRVDVPGAQVFIGGRAIVLIVVDEKTTHIFDLNDNSSKSVRIVYDQRLMPLHPGAEVSIVNATRDHAGDLIMSDGIARRAMRVLLFDDSQYAVVDDFSLASAIQSVPCLAQLYKSTDKHDRAAVAGILKMAAILALMYDERTGPFTAAVAPAYGLADTMRIGTW